MDLTRDNEKETKSFEFAKKAHESINQKRKYTGEPYITHPKSVAEYVSLVPHTSEMIQAAYLHDVVEDTPVTIEEVLEEFGPTVAKYVEGLTDVSKPEDGNRALRKALDREHLSKQCNKTKTIKLADIIDNTSSIVEYGGDFAEVYIKECILLLDVLRGGNKFLWDYARLTLDKGMMKIKYSK